MNALAHNAIAQTPVHGSWKLAVCASLALVITLLSARLIDRSVVQTYLQASAQATPTLQLAQPVAPGSTAPVAARWYRI